MYILDEFYNGLDDKIIYGCKCLKCNIVYFPPKITCQDCFGKINKLIELPHTGTLKNFVNSYNPPHNARSKKKLLYGLIQIDKTDTPVIMPILNTKKKDLQLGMRVRVVWRNGTKIDSPHIVGFEPAIKNN
jgi:uncharacterized OB-fold protein